MSIKVRDDITYPFQNIPARTEIFSLGWTTQTVKLRDRHILMIINLPARTNLPEVRKKSFHHTAKNIQ